jgi:pyrroloquinoline quinone biosynthesis protein D
MRVPQIAPHYRLQFEPASKTHVLLYPEGLVELSSTAAEILGLCDGRRTAAEIVTILSEQYNDPSIANDVEEFLGAAYEHGWIKDA